MIERTRVHTLLSELSRNLLERDEAVRMAFLSAMAGESLFLLGPPGTAKSLIARRLKFAFHEARSFEYLMGRFSTPDEVFGPVSLAVLRDSGRYERIVERYLPDADIVFLDEIWKASPAIQNALLTVLNEKLFRNGTQEFHIPLKGLVAASNELPPASEELLPFWDRFLVRIRLSPVKGENSFEQLIRGVEDVYQNSVPHELAIRDEEYEEISGVIDAVTLPPQVIEFLKRLRQELSAWRPQDESESDLFYVSDRRWRKITRLLRAAAAMNGREAVDLIDCFLTSHCVWSTEGQIEPAFSIVSKLIATVAGEVYGDVTAVQSESISIRQSVKAETTKKVEKTLYEPIIYEGEYVRLLDFEGSTDARMWELDYQELRSDRELDVDLFFYDEGGSIGRGFAGAEQYAGRLGERPGEVLINGESYRIEMREVTRTVEEESEPGRETRESLIERTNRLIEDCAAKLERIDHIRASGEREAEENLFVPRRRVEPLTEGLTQTQERIGSLLVDLEAQKRDVEGG